MTAERTARPHGFFGRRIGRPLRAQAAADLLDLMPRLKLDMAAPAPDPLVLLFEAPVVSVRLEIGFGGGEHLLHEALHSSATGFIGVEPFVQGLSKLVAQLRDEPTGNIRLYDDDAAGLLDWLPDGSLSGIDLFYPDPWPKRRHWKRRFVSPANLDRFGRVLKRGGLFRFASDIEHYVNWTLLHLHRHAAFHWTAEEADDWRRPFEGWPGTRYEAKALREGRAPAYLAFRRV